MQSQADAMVRHAILRKIVGADFFRAIAGLDLLATLGGDGFVLLGLLHFVEARAQDAHGLGAILDLRFFILLRDHQPAGNMRDAHSGIRGVHRLAAGARRAERINAQVLRFDLDVNFIGFGQHGNRGGGGVDAPLLLGGRTRCTRCTPLSYFSLE